MPKYTEVQKKFIPMQYIGVPLGSAWLLGWKASENNEIKSNCPYQIPSGRNSHFAKAWNHGYESQILAVIRGMI